MHKKGQGAQDSNKEDGKLSVSSYGSCKKAEISDDKSALEKHENSNKNENREKFERKTKRRAAERNTQKPTKKSDSASKVVNNKLKWSNLRRKIASFWSSWAPHQRTPTSLQKSPSNTGKWGVPGYEEIACIEVDPLDVMLMETDQIRTVCREYLASPLPVSTKEQVKSTLIAADRYYSVSKKNSRTSVKGQGNALEHEADYYDTDGTYVRPSWRYIIERPLVEQYVLMTSYVRKLSVLSELSAKNSKDDYVEEMHQNNQEDLEYTKFAEQHKAAMKQLHASRRRALKATKAKHAGKKERVDLNYVSSETSLFPDSEKSISQVSSQSNNLSTIVTSRGFNSMTDSDKMISEMEKMATGTQTSKMALTSYELTNKNVTSGSGSDGLSIPLRFSVGKTSLHKQNNTTNQGCIQISHEPHNSEMQTEHELTTQKEKKTDQKKVTFSPMVQRYSVPLKNYALYTIPKVNEFEDEHNNKKISQSDAEPIFTNPELSQKSIDGRVSNEKQTALQNQKKDSLLGKNLKNKPSPFMTLQLDNRPSKYEQCCAEMVRNRFTVKQKQAEQIVDLDCSESPSPVLFLMQSNEQKTGIQKEETEESSSTSNERLQLEAKDALLNVSARDDLHPDIPQISPSETQLALQKFSTCLKDETCVFSKKTQKKFNVGQTHLGSNRENRRYIQFMVGENDHEISLDNRNMGNDNPKKLEQEHMQLNFLKQYLGLEANMMGNTWGKVSSDSNNKFMKINALPTQKKSQIEAFETQNNGQPQSKETIKKAGCCKLIETPVENIKKNEKLANLQNNCTCNCQMLENNKQFSSSYKTPEEKTMIQQVRTVSDEEGSMRKENALLENTFAQEQHFENKTNINDALLFLKSQKDVSPRVAQEAMTQTCNSNSTLNEGKCIDIPEMSVSFLELKSKFERLLKPTDGIQNRSGNSEVLSAKYKAPEKKIDGNNMPSETREDNVTESLEPDMETNETKPTVVSQTSKGHNNNNDSLMNDGVTDYQRDVEKTSMFLKEKCGMVTDPQDHILLGLAESSKFEVIIMSQFCSSSSVCILPSAENALMNELKLEGQPSTLPENAGKNEVRGLAKELSTYVNTTNHNDLLKDVIAKETPSPLKFDEITKTCNSKIVKENLADAMKTQKSELTLSTSKIASGQAEMSFLSDVNKGKIIDIKRYNKNLELVQSNYLKCEPQDDDFILSNKNNNSNTRNYSLLQEKHEIAKGIIEDIIDGPSKRWLVDFIPNIKNRNSPSVPQGYEETNHIFPARPVLMDIEDATTKMSTENRSAFIVFKKRD